MIEYLLCFWLRGLHFHLLARLFKLLSDLSSPLYSLSKGGYCRKCAGNLRVERVRAERKVSVLIRLEEWLS